MYKVLHDRKTQKLIWIVLAILILPAFILWGAGNYLKNPRKNEKSYRLFGKTVSTEEFQASLQAIRNQAMLQFGDAFNQMQPYLNLETQAVERLILLKEAIRRKFKVSDKEVVDYISKFPLFQGKKGFDQQAYGYMLQYVFHTQPRVYEEQTRQNILIEKLYEDITAGVKIADDEVKATYKKENEQISVSYIAALTADFTKDVPVSEEEIKDYFSKHSVEFKQPQSFNLEYLVMDSEEKKNDIAARMGKKEDLSQAAQALNMALQETGLFGLEDPVPGIGWSPQIVSALLQLKLGETSVPIQVDKAYYIIRVKEIKDPYIPQLDAVKEKVRNVLLKEKAEVIAKQRIETAAKASPLDYEKLAKELGLKTADTGLFTSGSYIENIGASDEFFAAANNLKEGEFSQPIQMDSGFYLIRLKSRVAIDEAKFQQEKNMFSEKLTAQKKQEAFAKFYDELKKRALAGS